MSLMTHAWNMRSQVTEGYFYYASEMGGWWGLIA